LLFVLKRNLSDSYYILKGIGSTILNIGVLLGKHREINFNIRKVPDRDILGKIMDKRRLGYYTGKGLAYLTGRSF
jgi:hypothetical protein